MPLSAVRTYKMRCCCCAAVTVWCHFFLPKIANCRGSITSHTSDIEWRQAFLSPFSRSRARSSACTSRINNDFGWMSHTRSPRECGTSDGSNMYVRMCAWRCTRHPGKYSCFSQKLIKFQKLQIKIVFNVIIFCVNKIVIS